MTRISTIVACLAFAGMFGCSSTVERKPVFTVEGQLKFKGQPMKGAMIAFHPLNNPDPRAVRSQAKADADGKYRLTTYLKDDGAPEGEYAVTIYWPGKKLGKPKADDDDASDDLPPDQLQRVYAVAATTKLRATVQTQPNTIDFSLPTEGK